MTPALPRNKERIKAVDRRVNVLTKDYTKKAVGVDRNFFGLAEVDVMMYGECRVQRKPEGYGEVRGLLY